MIGRAYGKSSLRALAALCRQLQGEEEDVMVAKWLK